MSTATTWAPTREDLDRATARTADAIAHDAAPADIQRAAELEAALYDTFPAEPIGHRELEAHEADRELEAGG